MAGRGGQVGSACPCASLSLSCHSGSSQSGWAVVGVASHERVMAGGQVPVLGSLGPALDVGWGEVSVLCSGGPMAAPAPGEGTSSPTAAEPSSGSAGAPGRRSRGGGLWAPTVQGGADQSDQLRGAPPPITGDQFGTGVPHEGRGEGAAVAASPEGGPVSAGPTGAFLSEGLGLAEQHGEERTARPRV